MDQKYSHFSVEERAVIMVERSKGVSLRAIGRTLERNVSTISREINRGIPDQAIASIGHAVAYDATVAAATYRERRRRCGRRSKLMEATPLYQKVYDCLVYWGWSPQQISNRLRVMYLDDPTNSISYETIYAAIYAQPRGALKQGMVDALRQAKSARGRRRTTLAKGQTIPEAFSAAPSGASAGAASCSPVGVTRCWTTAWASAWCRGALADEHRGNCDPREGKESPERAMTQIGLQLACQLNDDFAYPALSAVAMAALVPQHAHGEARHGEKTFDHLERLAAIAHQPFRHQGDNKTGTAKQGSGCTFQGKWYSGDTVTRVATSRRATAACRRPHRSTPRTGLRH